VQLFSSVFYSVASDGYALPWSYFFCTIIMLPEAGAQLSGTSALPNLTGFVGILGR